MAEKHSFSPVICLPASARLFKTEKCRRELVSKYSGFDRLKSEVAPAVQELVFDIRRLTFYLTLQSKGNEGTS